MRRAAIESAFAITLVLATSVTALAQDEPATLTLRADASFTELAPRIAEGASRRLGRSVVVAPALAEGEAVTPSDIRLASLDGHAELLIVGASGAEYRTTLGLASSEAALVRAIVLSLVALVETAASDPGPPVAHEEEELLGPTDGSALRDLAPPFEPIDFTPRFFFEVRGRLGASTQRGIGLGGVGLAAGVRMGPYCVVLDADTLVPEEDHGERFGVLSYLFTTVGLGGRFLPLRAGPVSGGIGVALTLRTGHLWIESQSVSETTFAAGGRFSLEGAIALAESVAVVLSGGADIAFNPTLFRRAGDTVFVEDVVVLWGALGLRFGGGR